MVDQTQIRNAIQSKIFGRVGKSVTLERPGAVTYDDYGSVINANWQSSTITVVPYDTNEGRRTFERFGNQDSGDSYFVIPYTVTVAVGDRITMEGETYEIKELVKHYLVDNLVTIVRTAKIVA